MGPEHNPADDVQPTKEEWEEFESRMVEPTSNEGRKQMSKITTTLPEDGKTYGGWISHKGGDVHVYAQKEFAVIGMNKLYTDHVDYSDIALSLNADGTATLQVVGKGGVAEPHLLPAQKVAFAIETMLKVLEQSVRA